VLDWLKKKPQAQTTEIRETLFGDMPLSRWASNPAEASCEPWISFERTRNFIESGDKKSATASLQQILETQGLESRHYLQAYHFLRELGVSPPREEEKRVLGVVIEVAMKGGTDLVAAYTDHHARYYNYSGAAVVWERPNDTLDAAIDELLRVGDTVAKAIGPWKEARPPAPANGSARINLLTPSGLHFGEGPLDTLAKDKLGGPVIASAFRLMQRLTHVSKKPLPVDPNAPVLKIAVMSDGRITVDGAAATIDSLRNSLKRMAEQNGVVWYYREAGETEAPPESTEVMKAVIENRLPIRLSSRPDFSNTIGPDGRPVKKGSDQN